MYPLVKKRSVSLNAEKQVGEKKRKITQDADVSLQCDAAIKLIKSFVVNIKYRITDRNLETHFQLVGLARSDEVI